MSKYYRGGHKVILGGAPCRLSFKPHTAMLAAMRADQRESRAAFQESKIDYIALEYALWLARRDGLAVPEAMTLENRHGPGVRPVIVREWVRRSPDDWRGVARVRAIEWQEGVWRTTRDRLVWRTRKGKRAEVTETEDCWHNPWWECEVVRFRIDIPHWDWQQPDAIELTRHATHDYLPPPQPGRETHAACGDSRPTAQRDLSCRRGASGHV